MWLIIYCFFSVCFMRRNLAKSVDIPRMQFLLTSLSTFFYFQSFTFNFPYFRRIQANYKIKGTSEHTHSLRSLRKFLLYLDKYNTYIFSHASIVYCENICSSSWNISVAQWTIRWLTKIVYFSFIYRYLSNLFITNYS